jgi:hypothetical protein
MVSDISSYQHLFNYLLWITVPMLPCDAVVFFLTEAKGKPFSIGNHLKYTLQFGSLSLGVPPQRDEVGKSILRVSTLPRRKAGFFIALSL